LPAATLTLRSVITCPKCGAAKEETMPDDACQILYDCTQCGARLRPKPGDCCVFCSHGDVPCPPIQKAQAEGTPADCCAVPTQPMAGEKSAARRADWVGSIGAGAAAWWIPLGAIIAGLFLEPPLRPVVWIVALGWMGTACLLNARRCGRTHCRYTGPFYLSMILPVGVAGLGLVGVGFYGWLALCLLIVLGGKLIWFATEALWGKYS